MRVRGTWLFGRNVESERKSFSQSEKKKKKKEEDREKIGSSLE